MSDDNTPGDFANGSAADFIRMLLMQIAQTEAPVHFMTTAVDPETGERRHLVMHVELEAVLTDEELEAQKNGTAGGVFSEPNRTVH